MKITVYSDNSGLLWYCPTQNNTDNVRFEDQSAIGKIIQGWADDQNMQVEIDGRIQTVEVETGQRVVKTSGYPTGHETYFEKRARIVPSKSKEEEMEFAKRASRRTIENILERESRDPGHDSTILDIGEPKEEPKTHSFHSNPEDLKREKEANTKNSFNFASNGIPRQDEVYHLDRKTVKIATEKERDEFAIGFADYMRSERWRYDHREQKEHTDMEHLEHYKQSLAVTQSQVQPGKVE